MQGRRRTAADLKLGYERVFLGVRALGESGIGLIWALSLCRVFFRKLPHTSRLLVYSAWDHRCSCSFRLFLCFVGQRCQVLDLGLGSFVP